MEKDFHVSCFKCEVIIRLFGQWNVELAIVLTPSLNCTHAILSGKGNNLINAQRPGVNFKEILILEFMVYFHDSCGF